MRILLSFILTIFSSYLLSPLALSTEQVGETFSDRSLGQCLAGIRCEKVEETDRIVCYTEQASLQTKTSSNTLQLQGGYQFHGAFFDRGGDIFRHTVSDGKCIKGYQDVAFADWYVGIIKIQV